MVGDFIALIVSFSASIIGAICGIGGGVIIKPVLDSVGIMSVASVSFLSGCTVLAMSTYSVIKTYLAKESTQSLATLLPLALGAAIGGIVGKDMFSYISSLFSDANKIGAIQAGCLIVITIGTLIYTLKKDKIKQKKISNKLGCLCIGMVLGILSSFLGIGGGPINLVVLYYFFSMSVKEASTSSLFIIFFSQFASVSKTIVDQKIPEFQIALLIGMTICGIMGGVFGRKICKKITDEKVQKLFILLMIAIILINIYNVIKFL